MKQKVIVVDSANVSPTEKLEKELSKYRNDWRIISATTIMVPFDSLDVTRARELSRFPGSANQIYYCTTVIIEQVG